MAKLLLFLVLISTAYTIFYRSTFANGLGDRIDNLINAGILADTAEPLRKEYTGIEPFDRILTVLVSFFWSLFDGSHPGLSLHSIAFCGTFGAGWVLISLEAWRRANAWSIAAL